MRWGATSTNTATFTRTSRLLKLWQCAGVSGSIRWRFVIKAMPVLSSRVNILISWHKVAYPFYPAVRSASKRSTRIRQAIPSRKKVLSRSERQGSTEVIASIAGSHKFRRTASAKSLFLLLRVIIKFSKVRAIFKGQEMRMMLGKKERNKTESLFYCWKRYSEIGLSTASNLRIWLCIIPPAHMGSIRISPKYRGQTSTGSNDRIIL